MLFSTRRMNPAASLRPTIYHFQSTGKSALNAFTLDRGGDALPVKFGPWRLSETISSDKRLPFGLSKKAALAAIKANGCALWRMKAAPADTPKLGA